jgi:hypothetical protein
VVNVVVGTTPAQGHCRVVDHCEVAWWRRYPTPASNRAQPRAGKGKIGVGVGWLPQEKALGRLNGGKGMTRSRVDGSGATAARRKTGERGRKEIEGEGGESSGVPGC